MVTVLFAACWAASAQRVAVAINRNFSGISYGSFNTNSSALPPDCNGAVGVNHFVELINGTFAVYAKNDGSRVRFMTDLDFWAQAGVGVPADWDVTDPRIIFDPVAQRWFASQVDVDVLSLLLFGTLSPNHFLLAVSATADPTGPWQGVAFDADPDTGNFADFPTLGIDGDGVYLSGDLFDVNNLPVGPGLVSLPKADLLLPTPSIANRTWFGVMSYSQRGQVLQPATCLDGSSHGAVLAAGDIGNDSNPHSTLVSFAVGNATAAATLSPAAVVTVPPYVVPFNGIAAAPLFTPAQPDGTFTLMANDARLSANVYAVGGVLYAVHSTELNGRIAIRWYRIRAADATLLESGTIADTNLDLFFPSIAANALGTVVIACNGSSLNTFVSSCAFVGQTLDGVTTFDSLLRLRSGVASYHGDDEALNRTSRWGDYSATTVDPSDPSRFWTIQTYPAGVNVWSTQVTELLTAPLRLGIGLAGSGAVKVSWPSLAAGYRLQTATDPLSPTAWSDVTQLPLINGNAAYVILPVSPGQQFFRLRQL